MWTVWTRERMLLHHIDLNRTDVSLINAGSCGGVCAGDKRWRKGQRSARPLTGAAA